MIKYIGSKRTLVSRIVAVATALRAFGGPRTGTRGGVPAGARRTWTACDLFCGTTRVAQGLKEAGFFVTANDLATYAEVLATAYVEADARRVGKRALAAKLARLNTLDGRDGYVTQTFCEEARYFQPFNGRRIDAIRGAIDDVADGRVERAILLTSLLEAADRVDSTTGLQMAYLKSWAPLPRCSHSLSAGSSCVQKRFGRMTSAGRQARHRPDRTVMRRWRRRRDCGQAR